MQKFKINVVDSFGNNSSIEFDTNEKAVEYLVNNNLESDITIFEEDCDCIPSKRFKLTNSYFMSDTVDVNYNIKCIKTPAIIDENGLRIEQNYYFSTEDSSIYNDYDEDDLIVKEEFIFTLDLNNDVDYRLLKIWMTNEDSELVLVKQRSKFYNEIEKMIERKERRQNLINQAEKYLKDNLNSTDYNNIVSNTAVNVDKYVKGATTQLLNYFEYNINLTTEQKTVILGILDR